MHGDFECEWWRLFQKIAACENRNDTKSNDWFFRHRRLDRPHHDGEIFISLYSINLFASSKLTICTKIVCFEMDRHTQHNNRHMICTLLAAAMIVNVWATGSQLLEGYRSLKRRSPVGIISERNIIGRRSSVTSLATPTATIKILHHGPCFLWGYLCSTKYLCSFSKNHNPWFSSSPAFLKATVAGPFELASRGSMGLVTR